jgi:hypothetical protein
MQVLLAGWRFRADCGRRIGCRRWAGRSTPSARSAKRPQRGRDSMAPLARVWADSPDVYGGGFQILQDRVTLHSGKVSW